MKMKHIEKTTPEITHALEKGRGHYGLEDDEQALFQLLIRSVGHAEQDDRKQDVEIQNLKQRVSSLENLLKKLS